MARSRPLRFWAVLLGLLVALAGSASAQSLDPATAVDDAEAAYERLDYAAAERLARAALADFDAYGPGEVVRLHTLLGLLLYARGDELDAATEFRAALTLDAGLALDPLLVSPATIGFFEETKAAFQREQSSGTAPGGGGVRYIRVYDPRPAALVRSLALPGWGQRFKGEQVKGWALTGLWAATVAGTAVAEVRYRQARDAYDTEMDPTRTTERYDTLNSWYHVRNNAALGIAAVWAYAALDAGLLGGPSTEVGVGPQGASLRVRF